MKKNKSVKKEGLFLTCFFINYCSIIDSCYYSQLFDKNRRKHLLRFHNTNNKSKKFDIDSIN